MGDDMFDFNYDEYENVAELQFAVSASNTITNALEVRRTLEAAIRRIPDSALHGLRSFRITVTTHARNR